VHPLLTKILNPPLKDAFKAELQRLIDTGIILPVDEPTDWVNKMCVSEKESGICIDPRPLNKVL